MTKLWLLVLFSFNMEHATLTKLEFNSQQACLEALELINSTRNSNVTKNSPVSQTTQATCIEDKRVDG